MAELQQIRLGKLVNNTGQIAGVPKNPRQIRNEQYDKLLQSLKESDLTDYKPLMVYPQDGKFIVLGGNMRLRALRELKAETVSCIIVPEGTPAETLRKLVIIDNTEYGEYDWDAIANEWDADALSDWGVVLPAFADDVTDILDEANFESLNDACRENTNAEQITLVMDKEKAAIINAYIKEHTKPVLIEKIVELCQQQEAKS